MMKRLMESRLWLGFARIQRAVLFVLCIATTIIVGLACILRYLFHTDLLAYTEYLLIVAFWLYMIGGTHGSYEKSHISADILSVYMKDGMATDILNLIKLTLSLALSAVFLIWAVKFAVFSFRLGGRTPVLQIPRILGEVSIAAGYAFITFYNLVYFLEGILLFRKKRVKKNLIGGEVG